MTDRHTVTHTKVRVESDGTLDGTRVYDGSGNDLSRLVTGVSWEHPARDSIPTARVEIAFVPVVVEGRLKMTNADGREIRRIEYVDGGVEIYGDEDNGQSEV